MILSTPKIQENALKELKPRDIRRNPNKHRQSRKQLSEKDSDWSERNSTLHQKHLEIGKQKLLDYIAELGSLADSPFPSCVSQYIKDATLKIEKSKIIYAMTQARVDRIFSLNRPCVKWTKPDFQILIWIIARVAQKQLFTSVCEFVIFVVIWKNTKTWSFITSLLPGSQALNYKSRWRRYQDFQLIGNEWTEQEIHLLAQTVEKESSQQTICWKKIAQKLNSSLENQYCLERTPRQCKDRWNCLENFKTKRRPWTLEEDIALLCGVQKVGGFHWIKIAKDFPSRTDNSVKNRYKYIMKGIPTQQNDTQKTEDDRIQQLKQQMLKKVKKSSKPPSQPPAQTPIQINPSVWMPPNLNFSFYSSSVSSPMPNILPSPMSGIMPSPMSNSMHYSVTSPLSMSTQQQISSQNFRQAMGFFPFCFLNQRKQI